MVAGACSGWRRLVDYALLQDDIAADVVRANARGLDLEGPLDGGRRRPDGERLAWQTARSPRPDVPFLCGDLTPRNLRVPEGEVQRHPNGIKGVEEVIVAVEDTAATALRYEALIETSGRRDGRDHVFELGSTRIRLASRDADPAYGIALDRRGEGPVGLRLLSEAAEGELDRAKAHGARLAVGGNAATTA